MRVHKRAHAAYDLPAPERFGQTAKIVRKQVPENRSKNTKHGDKGPQLAVESQGPKQAIHMIFYTFNFQICKLTTCINSQKVGIC